MQLAFRVIAPALATFALAGCFVGGDTSAVADNASPEQLLSDVSYCLDNPPDSSRVMAVDYIDQEQTYAEFKGLFPAVEISAEELPTSFRLTTVEMSHAEEDQLVERLQSISPAVDGVESVMSADSVCHRDDVTAWLEQVDG